MLTTNPATVPGFFCLPSSHTVQKTTTTSLQLSLCDASHKINSFCYQTVNIKTHQSISISIDATNSNSYYYHIATTQRYGNHLIHCCDDRLDPQLEFQQAPGSARGEADAWTSVWPAEINSTPHTSVASTRRLSYDNRRPSTAWIRAEVSICSAAQLTGRSFYGSSTLRNSDR